MRSKGTHRLWPRGWQQSGRLRRNNQLSGDGVDIRRHCDGEAEGRMSYDRFFWPPGKRYRRNRATTIAYKTGMKLLTLNCVAAAPGVMGITGMPLHSVTPCATAEPAAHRRERRRRRGRETEAERALATRIAGDAECFAQLLKSSTVGVRTFTSTGYINNANPMSWSRSTAASS